MAGILLVCVPAILWGTVGVANRLMSDHVIADPAVVGLARTSLGALSLLIAAQILRLPAPVWRAVPLGRLALFGVSGAAFQICLFAAFREVGVTVTVAVTVCAPVVLVAVTDAVRLRKLPKMGVALAVAIASTGVVLAAPAAGSEGVAAGQVGARGALLLAGASVSFAVLAAVSRTITRKLHPVWTAGLGLAAAALVLALVAGWTDGGALRLFRLLPGGDMAILAYTGIAATGGAYLAFVLGMHLSSSAAAGLAATLIEPGVAALLAGTVLDEALRPAELAGCGLMMAAMVLLFAAERRRESQPV
jgi:drug/metabolite transporter, DME family